MCDAPNEVIIGIQHWSQMYARLRAISEGNQHVLHVQAQSSFFVQITNAFVRKQLTLFVIERKQNIVD